MRISFAHRLLPRSLRWQFTIALAALAVLILAVAATALSALRESTAATRQLAGVRLARAQDAQDLVQLTLAIQQATYQLLSTNTLDSVHLSYTDILGELAALDRSVDRLVAQNPDVDVLDLHEARQLFGNTTNIVAQLRITTLQGTIRFERALDDQIERLQGLQTASLMPMAAVLYRLHSADNASDVQRLHEEFAYRAREARHGLAISKGAFSVVGALDMGAQDPFELRLTLLQSRANELRFNDQLKRQSLVLVSVARQQSSTYTREFRDAMQHLVDSANHYQVVLWVLLGANLLCAWLIARVFLGRQVLDRLGHVSHYLRIAYDESFNPVVPVQGHDEIGEMARAVEQFMRDRQQLAKSNQELTMALTTLQLAKEELVRSEKLAALGAMVAGIAHELNTPIGNCLMIASTLAYETSEFSAGCNSGIKRSTLEAFLRDTEFANDILMRNLRRTADLVTSFKQIAVDQSSSQRRQFELHAVIEENIRLLSMAVDKTPIAVSSNIPKGLKLDSFPGPLGQVLVNLINNALIHGFDGRQSGHVEVSVVSCDGSYVELIVKDDGVGIPPENLTRIFDPFFTTRLGSGGPGLGLNIVHNIVTGVLSGRIQVHSEVGVGTTFLMILPLVTPRAVLEVI